MSFILTKRTNPATVATVSGRYCAVSPDGTYVNWTSNFAANLYGRTYKRSGTTLTALPVWAGTGGNPGVSTALSCHFKRDGTHFILGAQTTPFLRTYFNNADTWTREASGGAVGNSQCNVARYSQDGTLAVGAHNGAPYLNVFKVDGTSGQDVFTPLTKTYVGTAPNTASANDVAISPDNQHIALAQGSIPFIGHVTAIDTTANTITLTALTQTTPVHTQPGLVTSVVFHPDNIHFAMFEFGGGGVALYKLNGDGATYTYLRQISTAANPRTGRWSLDGHYFFCADATNVYIMAYDAATETINNQASAAHSLSPSVNWADASDDLSVIALVASSSSAPSVAWYTSELVPTMDVKGVIPTMTGQAVLEQHRTVRANGTIPAMTGVATFNQYTIEYPTAPPYEFVPGIVTIGAPQPEWTQEQVNGLNINHDYGAYQANLTTKITYDATINHDYGSYDATLLEHYPAIIDYTYGAYAAGIQVEEVTNTVSISAIYGAYDTTITTMVVPNANIDMAYGLYDAEIIAGQENEVTISHDYGTYTAEITSSAVGTILYTYGKYDATLNVNPDIGAAIVNGYGQYIAQINVTPEQNGNILQTYGKYDVTITGRGDGGFILQTYGKYDATIDVLQGKFVDMNYAYGKYEAEIDVNVSGRGRITFMLIQP